MQFLWEPYTATVMSVLPPICLIGSVAWCAVVPLICFHIVEWHQPDRVLRQFGMQQPILECPSQPLNIHGLTLKGKHDENWFQLLASMISQGNNQAEFRVDVYPRQQGLLSFNSDYMVWYRRKTKMLVDLKNANTTTLQHDAPMATPNAPLAPQWNVPEQYLIWKRGDIAAEEILIVKREDGINHVAHPHNITDTIMNDFNVSV
ncbi:Serine/threonine-protein phosphatase 7 long form [Glycine max]|nr:Serine/threonine-protein phosphatase 7 long form [Glycine max]